MASNQILHHHPPFTLTHVPLIFLHRQSNQPPFKTEVATTIFETCHTKLLQERHPKFFPTPILKFKFSANLIFAPTATSNLKNKKLCSSLGACACTQKNKTVYNCFLKLRNVFFRCCVLVNSDTYTSVIKLKQARFS